MNKPERIIVHHSLTEDGLVVDWEAIRKYHKEVKGWSDIGYHYGIERVGDKWVIQKGRAENVNGAHCKEQEMNFKSIGICVVGNYDIDNVPQEAFNLLVELIKDINKRYGKKFPIEPHSKYATYKTCPGKKFPLQKLIETIYPPAFTLTDAIDLWNKVGVIGSPGDMKIEFVKGTLTASRMEAFLIKSAKFIKEKGLV